MGTIWSKNAKDCVVGLAWWRRARRINKIVCSKIISWLCWHGDMWLWNINGQCKCICCVRLSIFMHNVSGVQVVRQTINYSAATYWRARNYHHLFVIIYKAFYRPLPIAFRTFSLSLSPSMHLDHGMCLGSIKTMQQELNKIK